MSDSLDPNQRLLSALDLGPSWARAAVLRPATSSPRKASENKFSESSERGDGAPSRRDSFRGGARNERGPRKNFPRDEKREFTPREEIKPAPGVKVSVEPNHDAIHLISKEIVHVARVYSLFDIAKTLLSQRERFHGIFTVEADKPPLYHGHRDNSLWLTKEEAVAHFWKSEWFSDFYEMEEVETDGPSGNFQVIAKCGISGVVLGPPNYHGYQAALRQLHRERFANMPFDRYASRIVSERNEEAVNAWVHSMKFKPRWKAIGEENAEWLNDKQEVEQHFINNRFPEVYVSTHQVAIPAITSGKLFSPSVLVHLKNAANHASRHPAIIIPTICQLLEKEHLPVFKKQGKLYAGPSRPHPIPENTAFADRPSQIVEWLTANPETKLAKLWQGVLPADAPEPTQEWLADLYWLLSQGHVLLFADDTLILPLRKKAEEKPAAKKEDAPAAQKTKAAKKKKRKPRKFNLLTLTKRVSKMSPTRLRLTRGVERTVAHRLRLKSKLRAERVAEILDLPNDSDDAI